MATGGRSRWPWRLRSGPRSKPSPAAAVRSSRSTNPRPASSGPTTSSAGFATPTSAPRRGRRRPPLAGGHRRQRRCGRRRDDPRGPPMRASRSTSSTGPTTGGSCGRARRARHRLRCALAHPGPTTTARRRCCGPPATRRRPGAAPTASAWRPRRRSPVSLGGRGAEDHPARRGAAHRGPAPEDRPGRSIRGRSTAAVQRWGSTSPGDARRRPDESPRTSRMAGRPVPMRPATTPALS